MIKTMRRGTHYTVKGQFEGNLLLGECIIRKPGSTLMQACEEVSADFGGVGNPMLSPKYGVVSTREYGELSVWVK